MVLITGYQKKQKDEKEFLLLELQGDVEIVISETTGLPYATMRKTLMSSTFDENTCKALIGKELTGEILKVETDEYEYTVQATGEVKTLNYRYMYSANGKQTAEQAVFS
ncbi:hypothetical protein [Pedobacter sp.]|uniref:hypothetical protein n=1 Tax=Pedobacter sp. TaxID=1411316 RepID=UPI003BAAA5F6